MRTNVRKSGNGERNCFIYKWKNSDGFNAHLASVFVCQSILRKYWIMTERVRGVEKKTPSKQKDEELVQMRMLAMIKVELMRYQGGIRWSYV